MKNTGTDFYHEQMNLIEILGQDLQEDNVNSLDTLKSKFESHYKQNLALQGELKRYLGHTISSKNRKYMESKLHEMADTLSEMEHDLLGCQKTIDLMKKKSNLSD